MQARKELPKRNKTVGTPHGLGKVIDVHPLQDAVTVLVEDMRYLVTRDEEAAMGELQSGIRVATHAFPAAGDDIAVSGSEEPSGDRNSGLKSLVQTVKGEAERNAILTALEQTQWNRRAAARLLQVSYRTLLYKIQQYNMTPVRFLSPLMGSNGTKGNGHGR